MDSKNHTNNLGISEVDSERITPTANNLSNEEVQVKCHHWQHDEKIIEEKSLETFLHKNHEFFNTYPS